MKASLTLTYLHPLSSSPQIISNMSIRPPQSHNSSLLPTKGLPLTMQAIPTELWVYIFIHALPISYPSLSELQSRPNEIKITYPPLIPIVISSVCRWWREVACNTPRLWSTCWLSYKSPELNDLWIGRAGTRSLTLHGIATTRRATAWMSELVTYPDGASEEIAFILSILRHLQRWRSITIDIVMLDDEDTLENWMQWLARVHKPGSAAQPDWNAPLLESFRIEQPEADFMETLGGFEPIWATPVLANAPSLRELQLFDARHSLSPWKRHQLRLSHLIKLDISVFYSINEAIDLLELLPELQSFAASVDCAFGMNLVATRHVTHQNLVHVHIRDVDTLLGLDSYMLLDFLTLPSLQVFHASYGVFPIDTFWGLLQRSECHLAELVFTEVIVGLEEEFEEFTALLQHDTINKSLKRLKIQYSGIITAKFLRFLQYDPDRPRLSWLEQLDISECYYPTQPDPSQELEDGIGNGINGLIAELMVSRLVGSCECEYGPTSSPREDGPMVPLSCLQGVTISELNGPAHCSDITRLTDLSQSGDPSAETCTVKLGLMGEGGKEFVLPISRQKGCDAGCIRG